MKLQEIRAYHVECELPEVARNSIASFRTRGSLVVELVTDAGLSGWGETQNPPVVWGYIETALARHVLGRDPLDSTAIWRAMLGERSAGDTAARGISAIDMALWDLKGRILGQPVSKLLGGRLRDAVTAYASGPFMKLSDRPYEDVNREVDRFIEEGFVALKARSGITPREDGDMLVGLRRRLGPNYLLMADFNRGYSIPSTLELARRVEEADLLWIEEPIGADDLAGYRLLASRIGIAVAGGEALSDLADFRDFLAARALDVIQPDLFQCGGFTGALRIAALAEAYCTPYVPHVWGTLINFNASLQLAATLPSARIRQGFEFPLFEYDQGHNPLVSLQGAPSLTADGKLSIPDAPGIGVEVKADTFAPYIRNSWRVGL